MTHVSEAKIGHRSGQEPLLVSTHSLMKKVAGTIGYHSAE